MKKKIKQAIVLLIIVLFILLIVQVIYDVPNMFLDFIVWLRE